MIKEDAFKTWLEQGGAASIAGQNSRVSAIRTIERKLDELAMPFRNLDEAWEADRFESLSKRLGRMRKNARDGGHDYRILMPDSENPHNRLPSWRSWLGQYGRFLAGEPPGSAKDADRIRQYVLEYYIEPAREEERGQADVLVRDVNTALGLNEAWPNICQALAGRKFQEQAQIRPPERIGADKSSATVFRFDLRDYIHTETIPDTSEGRERRPMPISPVNLILYGPPGTGKTYSTAAEAVGLCGEPVPEDREALMQTYQRLLAAGRIEFVTFHQSMSYEDFVEGRQPVTDSDDDGDASSTGFRLETVPGIFRRIARRAETSHGRLTEGDAITVAGRQVFKMSIGQANNPEDTHLFEEAIDGGYALLGFDDIDWGDEKFANKWEIITACNAVAGRDTDVNARSGAAQMPFIFRNWVREGDIVVVSRGNSLFRQGNRI